MERPFTAAELEQADEIIVTSSSTPGVAAKMLNGAPVGGKDRSTFEKIRESAAVEFETYVEERRA